MDENEDSSAEDSTYFPLRPKRPEPPPSLSRTTTVDETSSAETLPWTQQRRGSRMSSSVAPTSPPSLEDACHIMEVRGSDGKIEALEVCK
jgi:hypothetical protein